MTTPGSQVTEAVYSKGVLKPVQSLDLREEERVRLVVERIDRASVQNRDLLLARLREGIESMSFRSRGVYPARDELHDRV